ncbi:MAG: RNA polymerase sigma-70 factor [Bacteroidales bacterium]|jgi:RNA polymerase sigma-70 factor (ECF subfamily)|nr:RNA polymerase sigma-70 factor [Bacteroidales bacterium]
MTFKEFYTCWYSRTTAFAYEYLLSEDDANDVVQDVFVDLYEKYDLLSRHVNLTAYLFTSLKNRCIDVLRHRMAEKEAMNRMQEEYELTLRMKFDSLEILDNSIFDEDMGMKMLENALAVLPERCRMIFVKHKLEGMRQKDIAAELGVSPKTVENQLTIAYRKMREALKPYFTLMMFFIINISSFGRFLH